MTGFDSKRQAAKAKLDDDTQVYADTLLIVYQRGFADGKAAQRKPLTDEMKTRCPYTAVSERGAFYDGWLSAEAAHGIKEGT
jgi:ribosome modulation factor